jgi:hypothetical protein
MRLYIVSSPENIARLDAIRADLDRLSDPRVASSAEAAQIAARTPTVVWISESVHGNESPGFESAMPLLYQLAASDEPATIATLRTAIVVLNPSSNPDGHERFTVWYNSIARSDPTNDAYEHREPWSVQGRFNHYRFDMNRDVMASTQPEVQALLRGMLRWHPQTAVDQHGHTVNYFFPPAARPVNAHIGAESEKWLSAIGRANAAAFDRYGWMYFVRDQFDLYYPGYWDTWPSLTGATGMTYETDGGGGRGSSGGARTARCSRSATASPSTGRRRWRRSRWWRRVPPSACATTPSSAGAPWTPAAPSGCGASCSRPATTRSAPPSWRPRCCARGSRCAAWTRRSPAPAPRATATAPPRAAAPRRGASPPVPTWWTSPSRRGGWRAPSSSRRRCSTPRSRARSARSSPATSGAAGRTRSTTSSTTSPRGPSPWRSACALTGPRTPRP